MAKPRQTGSRKSIRPWTVNSSSRISRAEEPTDPAGPERPGRRSPASARAVPETRRPLSDTSRRRRPRHPALEPKAQIVLHSSCVVLQEADRAVGQATLHPAGVEAAQAVHARRIADRPVSSWPSCSSGTASSAPAACCPGAMPNIAVVPVVADVAPVRWPCPGFARAQPAHWTSHCWNWPPPAGIWVRASHQS